MRYPVVILVAAAMTGCVPFFGYERGPGHGPPPHAPAHGRRAKHKGAELAFDPGIGAYIVLGHPGFYFLENHYYRLIDHVWHVGVAVHGPWNVIEYHKVPSGLVKKHGKGKTKDKGKGKGKK